MFVYRVRKYIGAYTAALSGRVDAVIFSAGIGENSSIIRGLICDDFKVQSFPCARGSVLVDGTLVVLRPMCGLLPVSSDKPGQQLESLYLPHM